MALIEKKHAIILFLAVLVLGILMFGAQGPDTTRNALITQSLRDLKTFDATLKQQLLQIYGGTLWQFDTLVVLKNRIRETAAELHDNIRIYDLGDEGTEDIAKPYLSLVAEQANLVEDFKSDIAIWRNSLALLELTEIQERQLSATQADPALLKELVGFRAEVLQFIVRPSEPSRAQIAARVGNIRNYLSNHPPNITHEFDTIVRHVETLVTYGRSLALALEQVMALPAPEYLDNIEKSYSIFYNDIISESNIYTILMFVCGALLLMGLTQLRVRPETLCRITEFSEHESNGRELDEGERVAVEVLPVLGRPAAAVEPGDGAFDHPTPGLDDEALHPIGSLDDLGLEIGQDAGQGAVKDRPLIGAVGEQFPEKGKQTEQGRQQRETAVAILNVGGGDDAVQQQALRIDQNMPLLALDQLAGIEAVAVDASPPFSALFTL